MYERHFGMTGPPFRLSPDPSFFFDSEQHQTILSAMRDAFDHELPFLVVSGEMGSGKTTMLRAWLDECRAEGVAVSQLTNTQLEGDELLWSVAAGFGNGPPPGTAADPRAVLRELLRGLNKRAALLVVDEAQNLNRDGLESLVALAEMAKEEGVVFRVCLAGQPELRERVVGSGLAKLQANIQRSCHLGALGLEETRRYIEHRLLKVGWSGRPQFEMAAFAEIQGFTKGIPRRINVLCNRLLLTEFLHEGSLVDARSVAVAASALEAEIDDGAIAEEPAPAPAPPAEFARIGQGVLVLVANGRSDHVKAISLLASFAECEGLPPAVVVSTSDAEVWMLNRGLLEGERFVHLAIARATDAVPALDHIGRRFAQMVEQCRPCAVVLFDGNAVSQMCASIAHERQVPLVHIGAQAQSTEELFDPVNCRTAISQFADLRFDCQPPSIGGLPPQALQSFAVGNLLIDSVRFTVQKALQQARPIGPSNPFADAVDDRVGYGVVVLRQWSEVSGWAGREELVAMLRAVSRDLPLIWPMRRSNLPMKANAAAPAAARNTRGKGRLKEKVKTGLVEALDGYRVVCIEELSYLEFIDLLLDATCVLTDSPDVIEEAAALQLPCLSFGECHVGQHGDAQWLGALQVGLSATRATRAVWQILFSGLEEAALPAEWDGHAGARIANRLAQWLAQRRGVMHGVADETSTPPI